MTSMVTERVVDDLGLPVEGYINVLHVGGIEERVPQFCINLAVFADLHFPGVEVVSGKLAGCDVIVGMDIINRGDFAVSNKNGATAFSFRIPSVEEFDFVKADEALNN